MTLDNMNKELLDDIVKIPWKHYLSRPFDILQTSVWNAWYDSAQFEKLFGLRLSTGLFVEYPRGTVRHYREVTELNKFFKRLEAVAQEDLKYTGEVLSLAGEHINRVDSFIAEQVE